MQLIGRVDRDEAAHLDPSTREAVDELAALGFIVDSRDAEDRALEAFFTDIREDASHLRVTLLTTLQCNFACDYCIQGDHEAHATSAARMSLEQAAQVGDWMEQRLDDAGVAAVHPDVLRRRASPEPARRVRAGRAHVGRLP